MNNNFEQFIKRELEASEQARFFLGQPVMPTWKCYRPRSIDKRLNLINDILYYNAPYIKFREYRNALEQIIPEKPLSLITSNEIIELHRNFNKYWKLIYC